MTECRVSPIAWLTLLAACAMQFLAQSAVAQEMWKSDQACNSKRAEFALTDIDGCERSMCSVVGTTRVCACILPSGERTRFQIETKNGLTQSWTAPFVPYMGVGSSLRVDQVDLDGDGQEALLVSAMSAQSVGIAISRWAVWAVTTEGVSQPLEIEDYGLMSGLTRDRGVKACRLFAARWKGGWEPRRGYGLYVVGRWYELRGSQFTTMSERPTVYRRYLYNLQHARGRASRTDTPLLWFKSRDTKTAIGPDPF